MFQEFSEIRKNIFHLSKKVKIAPHQLLKWLNKICIIYYIQI